MADEIQVGDVVKYSKVSIKSFHNITENHYYLVKEVRGGILVILGDNFTESAYSNTYFSKAKIKPSDDAKVGDLMITIVGNNVRKEGNINVIISKYYAGGSSNLLGYTKTKTAHSDSVLVIDQSTKYSIAKLYEGYADARR